MAISKSTPYVRYKKDFTSSLHLGTIHIESEYLDRTQKTTIESIHGMTWQNKVVNENKELNLLSDTQLELTELEKQYWNTGEKCVSVDEIHTLEEVEPNEDGTYTYTVNSMEGEYIEIYDGINNITSTSDGLDGQFEIVYDTTEEDVNGNIALDQVVSQYEITDSGVGTITSAKSTGLTLVNHITESSKEEVVAIEQQEGRHFTIENTVQGNIKSAILKGQTLVNYFNPNTISELTDEGYLLNEPDFSKQRVFSYIPLQPYEDKTEYTIIVWLKDVVNPNNASLCCSFGGSDLFIGKFKNGINIAKGTTKTISENPNIRIGDLDVKNGAGATLMGAVILKGDYTTISLNSPFYGMKSVQMPVLTTVGKNLFNSKDFCEKLGLTHLEGGFLCNKATGKYPFKTNGRTCMTLKHKGDSNVIEGKSIMQINYADGTSAHTSLTGLKYTFSKPIESIQVNSWQQGIVEVSEIMWYEVNEGETIHLDYEPFKSNILTVNEDVELRGIGDVRDELNCLTGELTQRVGEIVLDDTLSYEHAWNGDRDTETDYVVAVRVDNHLWSVNYEENGSLIKCDKLKTRGISSFSDCGYFLFYVSKSILGEELTNEKVRDYILSINATVQYPLATESIKTVDLTVQNQDGGTIPHIQTQQGITHVSTSSDGLIPVVEMSCSYDVIIKPNTTYTIKLDRPIVSDTMYLQVDLGGTMMMLDADVNAFTIKTPSTLSHSQLRLSGTSNTVKEIIVLEGNRVNDKIEYFEGMKNVENPILIVSNCPYVFGKGGRK